MQRPWLPYWPMPESTAADKKKRWAGKELPLGGPVCRHHEIKARCIDCFRKRSCRGFFMWNIGNAVRRAKPGPDREAGWNFRLCLICFFVGLAAGTVAGNWMYGRNWLPFSPEGPNSRTTGLEEGWISWGVGQSAWRQMPGNGEKFFYLLRRRLGEGMLGWILGLTVCAVPAFCVLALYGGFSMGWVITMCTLENGMFGLPVFLLSCFPQFLFYIPVWSLFAWWGLSGNRRLRVLPTFLAAGFLGLGAAAEAFWNPFFLKIL